MRKDKDAVFRQTHLVNSYEIDVRGRARPSVLFSYMLDGAWNHVRDSGFSHKKLLKDNKLWAASRFLIVFHTIPKWNQEVRVEMWGKGVDRFLALREFVLISAGGEKLASASSSWLIIDRKTNRPQKMERLWVEFPFQPGVVEIDAPLDKLPHSDKAEIRTHHEVLFTDLDINRHLTASRYMEWILDGFPEEVLEKKYPYCFEINFMAEAGLHDLLSVSIAREKNSYLCAIMRDSDGKEMCRARVTWMDARTNGDAFH